MRLLSATICSLLLASAIISTIAVAVTPENASGALNAANAELKEPPRTANADAQQAIAAANNEKSSTTPNPGPPSPSSSTESSSSASSGEGAVQKTSTPGTPDDAELDRIVPMVREDEVPATIINSNVPDKVKFARLCRGHTSKGDVTFCDGFLKNTASPEKKALADKFKQKSKTKYSPEKVAFLKEHLTGDEPPVPGSSSSSTPNAPSSSITESLLETGAQSPPVTKDWISHYFGSPRAPLTNGKVNIKYLINPEHLDEASENAENAYGAIETAIQEIHTATCINFGDGPIQDAPDPVIAVQYDPNFRDCMAYVTNARHPLIRLGTGCEDGALHELFHTLGFVHMLRHPNSWGYVDVNMDRVVRSRRSNHDMEPLPANRVDLLDNTFDFSSIMTYAPGDGCVNGARCVTVKSNHPPAPGVSDWEAGRAGTVATPRDWAALNTLYRCPGSSVPAGVPTRTVNAVRLVRFSANGGDFSELTLEWWIDGGQLTRDVISIRPNGDGVLPAAATAGHRLTRSVVFKIWDVGMLSWTQLGADIDYAISDAYFSGSDGRTETAHFQYYAAGAITNVELVVRFFRRLECAGTEEQCRG